MNLHVLINHIHVARTQYIIAQSGNLIFGNAPEKTALIHVRSQGCVQVFVGDGFTCSFALCEELQKQIKLDQMLLQYQNVLFEAMKHLDNETVRSEVDRLEIVLSMMRNYVTNKI